jgi:RND family efflux transporter MFP subunit
MIGLKSEVRAFEAVHAMPAAPPLLATSKSPNRRRPGHWRVAGFAALALAVLAAAFAVGAVPRLRQERALENAALESAASPPAVTVAVVRQAPLDAARVLPGNALPLLEAALYARATGYIKTRLVDIGDRVEEGQLLAVIDAPDIDDQLAQAKANLEQARAMLRLNEANANLAKLVLERSLRINGKGVGVVSQEEIDQQRATVGTTAASVDNAKASIRVNQATVQRFTDLQAFERITAPFPGIVTARHIEVGDLVSADSTSRQLFHLMRTDVLRVFVNVPQVYATGIKVGQAATVVRREDPEKAHAGKVTRTADALDPGTRTLLTEVQVPNPDNSLRPGMYLQVKFLFDREVPPVLIPAAALTTRTGGPRVAVLDDQQRVQYRDVKLGRDFGAEVEIVAGLKPGQKIVVHPGDDLPEGKTVIALPRESAPVGQAAP